MASIDVKKKPRTGIWNGKKFVFTHKDPKTNRVWGERLDDGKSMWIPSDEVNWD